MNIFLAVAPKDNQLLPGFRNFIQESAPALLPFGRMDYESALWDNGNVVSASYSIHAEHVPIRSYSSKTVDRFCSFNGIPLFQNQPRGSWADELLQGLSEDSIDLESLGGYYNLLFVDGRKMTAWNCISRVEPVYWADNDRCVVIGNRASLVQAVANQTLELERSSHSLLPLSTAGWLANDSVPFAGVNLLANGQTISVDFNGVHISDYKPYEYSDNEDLTTGMANQLYDEICNELVMGIKRIADFSSPLMINLSGGKDSRIMAALCAAADIPFYCVTSGSNKDREVVVASEVARILNAEHRTSERKPSDGIPQVDIFSKLQEHVSQGDGMINVFDPVYPIRLKPNTLLNGHGGECLRGGYDMIRQGARPEILDADMAAGFLKNLNLRNSHLFLKEDAEEFQRSTNSGIILRYLDSNFPISHFYDYAYTVYREGRGVANLRQASAYGAFAFSPFLNDNVLKLGWKFPLEARKSDTLYYNILLRLNHELAHHRFSDSRWKFESEGPGPETSHSDWLAREPLPPSPPQAAAHHWRLGYDDYMRDPVRDYLLQNETNEIYDFTDYNKLQGILNAPAPTNNAVMQSVFGLLTAAFFFNGDYL
ncbi:MAG: asparagine synthase-related protein [Myxococcota bacterium]